MERDWNIQLVISRADWPFVGHWLLQSGLVWDW